MDIASDVGWGKEKQLLLQEATMIMQANLVNNLLTVDVFKIKKGVFEGFMDDRCSSIGGHALQYGMGSTPWKNHVGYCELLSNGTTLHDARYIIY